MSEYTPTYLDERIIRFHEERHGLSLVRQLQKRDEENEEVRQELLRAGTIERIEKLAEHDPVAAERLARELTDTIIPTIAAIHALGFNFYHLFDDVMTLAEEKYDPVRYEEYLMEGMSPDEAMAQLKADWQAQNIIGENNTPIVY